MRECIQTLPVSLTPDAIEEVLYNRYGVAPISDTMREQAVADIFAAGYAARDAHPKWELFTIEVHGVTLQMRAKPAPLARLVVTID